MVLWQRWSMHRTENPANEVRVLKVPHKCYKIQDTRSKLQAESASYKQIYRDNLIETL